MELIHLIFVALFSFASSAEELYEWLGVPKTASSQEIKRAYKSLAKEWHPDKNDDPSATDRFTKINEAYETLKDPEKRANYDNYGYTSGQERQRHPGGGFHPFDEFFHGGFQHFGFGGRENNGMDRFLLNLREFETKYHPRTNQNPCFIYTYTDFCFNCMRIEPVVFKFMTELENVGMCVGAVHLRRSPGLASFLRLHNAPNILGVVDKRISTYKASGISFQTLRDFVKNLLPSNTLKLIKDDNFKDFLKGWKDNKVRAVFFGTKEDPSLRFLVPAFYHRDRIAFGYVYSQGSGVAQILKQYSINKYRESLLMWNEDTSTTMASITMQQLSRSAIDEVVSTNRYLSLPRLSSQTVFEELCPEEPKLKKRKLCVSLVTKNTEDHEMARNTFRAFAQQTSVPSERVKFSYMFEEVQHSFVKALTKGNETRSKLVVEVVIIWRFDTRRILYDFLEHGWNIEPELAPKSRQQLEDRLTQLLKGDNLLPYTTVIPEFYNEHMLGLFTRILYKLWDWSDRIYYYCTSYDGMSVMMAVGALVFLCVMGLSMKRMAELEAEQMKKSKVKQTQKRPPSCTADNQTIHLYELRYETFQNFVSQADTGLTITLLVDEQSKVKLMHKFAEIMQPFSRYSALTFAFLQLEYYLEWYRHLLELSMDFKVTLDSINNRNCIGTVLAINGYRKYYYIYHPKRARRWMRRNHGKNITKAVGFGDSDSDSSEDGDAEVLFLDEVLSGLSIWMDRVFDGSVKKVRLNYWPEMSK